MSGHGQFAGGEHPAAALLGRGTQRSQRIAIVGGGIGPGGFSSSEFHTDFMSQRTEDVLGEEIHELFAADFFDDEAGDDVVGVGVLPLRAGIEVERLLAQASRICCAVSGFTIGVIR